MKRSVIGAALFLLAACSVASASSIGVAAATPYDVSATTEPQAVVNSWWSGGFPLPLNDGPYAGVSVLYRQNPLGGYGGAAGTAALQAATWEGLYDTTSPNLSDGNFGLASGGGTLGTFAQEYLDHLIRTNGTAEGFLFPTQNIAEQGVISMPSVPEPASLLLFGSGLLGIGLIVRRRTRALK